MKVIGHFKGPLGEIGHSLVGALFLPLWDKEDVQYIEGVEFHVEDEPSKLTGRYSCILRYNKHYANKSSKRTAFHTVVNLEVDVTFLTHPITDSNI